jgi:hypothetical protein
MEPAPVLLPPPAIVEDRSKPVVIRPPEVNSAHDYAIIGYLLVFLMTIPWFIIVLTIGALGILASPYLPFPVILPPTLPTWLTSVPLIGALLIILTFPGVGLTPSWFVYLGFGVIGLLAVLIFLGILYFSTVRNINKGRYERARAATLFFAVLFLIPVFLVLVAPASFFPTVILLIPAFFFFMAYGRLGEVIAKYGPVAVLGEAVPGVGVAGSPPGPPMLGAAMPPMGPMVGSPVGPMGGAPMGPMVGPPMGPMGSTPMGPYPSPMATQAPSAPAQASKTPQCPTCGRDLYYSANHRRWYCQTCDSSSSHL